MQPDDPNLPSPADPQALDPGAWLERHGDALFRFAMQRLRDRNAAEEAVQECFVAALAARDRFTGASSERTWLIGILKHKIIDLLRRRTRERIRQSEPDAGAPDDFDERGLWRGRVGRWPGDPREAMQTEEFRRALADCISALPEKYAIAFVLREIDGVDSQEICQLLDISPTNLWARLHRARLGLRKCLEKHWLKR
jgi:RNA polymerase sigma-70 factor (ECF subfamily)